MRLGFSRWIYNFPILTSSIFLKATTLGSGFVCGLPFCKKSEMDLSCLQRKRFGVTVDMIASEVELLNQRGNYIRILGRGKGEMKSKVATLSRQVRWVHVIQKLARLLAKSNPPVISNNTKSLRGYGTH